MLTIKEIANMANVSTATVSHVLNGTARVSEETRDRVLNVVREANYKPNNIAKSLKIRKTNSIGIITEDITVFNTPAIIDGINEYAEKYNYHIILNNIMLYKKVGNKYKDADKYTGMVSDIVDDLVGKQVEGIIYVGAHCRDVAGLIRNIPVPLVFAYCYSNGGANTSIYYDDEAAAYEITKYLINKNHKKIGIITGLLDSIQCQDRLKGFQRVLYENNILFNPQYLRVGDWEFDKGYIMGKELLGLQDPPTAIFSMNDIMAGGVIEAANELGLNIPRDFSLVGFDNRECSYSYSPRLTTMALPLNEIGKSAAETLIEVLKGNSPERGKTVKLQCKLIERRSVVTNI
jgi:Transcriptional regulators